MGTIPKAPIAFPLPADLTNCQVGRFRIKYKLGSGGMGEVYYAEDTALRRPVALKRVVGQWGNDPDARRHILAEAQRASKLNSEHIASVHDVLEESGNVFLVMEYVEGETLRQRMQRPLDLEEVYAIAKQCAEGLQAAHEQGVVHCDIKPENILLTAENKVKILDFGVARHVPRSEQSTTMDGTRQMAGTPGYMAPEILLEGLPDARSDLFSLGVVLYEMLGRRHPFRGSNLVTTSEHVLHEQPTPLRELNPLVPEGLASVVKKALAKAPEQRYASAGELLADLQGVEAGESALLATARSFPGMRRRMWRWLGVAAVGLATLVALRARAPAPMLAERGWVLVTDFSGGDGAIPADAVREGLTIALQQSHYVNVFPRARVYEVLQRMRQPNAVIDERLGREICQRENLQVLLEGGVESSGGTYQITVRGVDPVRGTLLFAERERFGHQGQFFEKTDALAGSVRRDLGESLDRIQRNRRPLAKVTTSSLEALELYSQAKNDIDRGNNQPVAELLKGALRLDPNFAMAHLELGRSYLAVVGKNEKAAAELEEAYRLRANVSDREQRRIEAGYYRLQEQYEDEQQALAALVSLYPDDEEAHLDLAEAYYDLGQMTPATAELREVLRLNPASALGYGNLVLFLAYGGRPEAAIAAASEAQQHGVDTPRMHWGIGLAQLARGELAQAQLEFEKIGHGTETDRQLRDLCLAMLDLYSGKLNAAKTRLLQQISETTPYSGGLETFSRYLLGRVAMAQGDGQAAGRQADLIAGVASNGLQVSDLLNAGLLYARSGRVERAQRILRRISEAGREAPSSLKRSAFHNLEAEIFLAQGKQEKAESSWTAAAQDYPQALPHAGLARSYEAQGQWEAAARQWEQFLANDGQVLHNDFAPDLAYAELALGRIYRRINNADMAERHYQRFLERWQHADDKQLLAQAKRELAALTQDESGSRLRP